MTEQEIITYLKENWNIGVAFVFMPREVRKWCEDNLLRTDIPFRKLVRDSLGYSWSKLNYDESFYCEYVYCLDEDYRPEFKPDWQEFDIDEDGYFKFEDKKYYYREDSRFESENRDRFKGFGGWLYIDSDKKPTWYMSPRIDGDGRVYSYSPIDVEAKPAIPTKIRFWRYKE